jgi:hypothetical protein
MTEDSTEGVPDTGPRHLVPVDSIADAVENGTLNITIRDDQHKAELRELLQRAERSEFDAAPGFEATVRIIRTVLDDESGTPDV